MFNVSYFICCPRCRGDLSQETHGYLCSSCDLHYPIREGIPRFVEPENYASSFGYQWNIHARTQLDSHSGLPISRDRVFSVTGWPERMEGKKILEAGSGAGRFTEILVATGADVCSFDYSTAVDANNRNNGAVENLFLFQGDIFHIPFKEETFDKVFCLGVLQHTPDPEAAFRCLASQVRSGGELVVDAYTRSFIHWLQWKYLLRPWTKGMDRESLYRFVSRLVDLFLTPAIVLRRLLGRAGARVVPIVQYAHLGLSPELNRQWAILDTFDMYSPAHDHPQSVATVRRWFAEAGFVNVDVRQGPNGVVGKGMRPVAAEQKDSN